MIKSTALIVGLAVLIGLVACSKSSELQLPDTSHTGSNTLGFLLNGEVRSAKGKSDNVISVGVIYTNWSDSTLQIFANNGLQSNSPRFNFSARFPWTRSTGNFPLTTSYPCKTIFTQYSDGTTITTGSNQYRNDSQHTGQVSITYWDGMIVAGTFDMDLVNDSGETVHITSGRFDISK